MSNLSHLVKIFSELPQTKQLTAALKPGGRARIELHGLVGSHQAFTIAASASILKQKFHLVISPDKEAAAYLQNDIEGVLEGRAVHFFPDSFKRPAFFDDLNPTQILQRSETVSKITATAAAEIQAEGQIVVTYPEALFEKVVRPEVLSKNRISVKTGEKLDVDFVMQVLIEYGFERADFVYEPGQFSIRGGIIDLFSYGNEQPYRIELFDDEVESIRIFDPLTQLSQRSISQLSIVPNLNTHFRQDQKISLLRVLPTETIFWADDFEAIFIKLLNCFERAEAFAKKITALDAAELREIFRDRAFLFPGEVIEELAERPVVFLDGKMDGVRKAHPELF